MFQKVLKQLFSLLTVIWGKHWTTCKPQIVDLGLLIKKMFSRSVHKWVMILHLSQTLNNTKTPLCCLQVCDQPHPLHVKNMVRQVIDGKFDDACAGLKQLYDLGYSPTDIITTLFRIIKNYDMPEYLKLEFMKVCMMQSVFHFESLENTQVSRSWITFKLKSCDGFTGDRICSYEDLWWSWFLSSNVWFARKACIGPRNSQSSLVSLLVGCVSSFPNWIFTNFCVVVDSEMPAYRNTCVLSPCASSGSMPVTFAEVECLPCTLVVMGKESCMVAGNMFWDD